MTISIKSHTPDSKWLRGVHGIQVPRGGVAILEGNEDSPNCVMVYPVDDINSKPTAHYSSVPNLDAMDPNELWTIWRSWRFASRKMASRLFPDKPKGYVGTMQTLACYASNKATAMGCRLSGNIQSALVYENIADKVYDRLPEYAKW